MTALPKEALEANYRAQSAIDEVRAAALQDPVLFQAVILRDEHTGKPIRPAQHHEEWHDALTNNRRFVLWASIEMAKTQSIAVARVLYELARDPNIRICVISNVHAQAAKILRVISTYIEQNEDVRTLTPLRPGDYWTSSAITVQRQVVSKDPSVQVTGIHGPILGSRLDLVIADDILDVENTRTPEQRQALEDWWLATVTGRLVESGRIWMIGTPWHPEDLLHRFSRKPGWGSLRTPVVDEETGEPRWPERWSQARIAAWAAELGPLEAARQLFCRARDNNSQRFKTEYIDLCKARGVGRTLRWGLSQVPPGYKIFTGVDLAVQEKDKADRTALFTIAIHPDGSREILCIESGHWGGPIILEKILDHHHRYQGIFVVENNGAQEYIVQFTRARAAIPILAYTTGRSKAHPEFGVERVAAEMASSKWIIPNEGGVMHPEVAAWVEELLFYHPTAHTGDRLMASWFCVEGERLLAKVGKAGSTRVDLLSR